MYRMGNERYSLKGFTIVELLIVIVVIAILAAITIVAYTGIQERAKTSAVQSAASQVAKTVATYAATNNDTYPTSLAAANISNTSDITYTYIVNNTTSPKNYCISATDTGNPAIAYAFTSASGGIVAGECVTNLATNPRLESGAVWGNNGGAAAVITNEQSYMDGQSMRVTRTGTGDDFRLANTTLQPGHTYSYSVWTYATGAGATGNSRNLWLYNQSGGTPYIDLRYSSSYNSWQLLSTQYVPINAVLTSRVYPMTGQNLYLDGMLIVETDNLYYYGETGLTGWAWNGAEHNSTSFGPALRQS